MVTTAVTKKTKGEEEDDDVVVTTTELLPPHDFLIDVLVPEVRASIGGALGPALADPSVVKVLHGADSDVLWLQAGH